MKKPIDASIDQKGKNPKNWQELLAYLRPYSRKIIIGLFLLSLTAFLETYQPRLLGLAVDELTSEVLELKQVYFLAFTMLLLMILKGVILYFSRYMIIGISRLVEYGMRNFLFRHILFLEPRFFDQNKSGDLLSRLTSDLEQIRMIFGPGILYTFNVFFVSSFAFWNMFHIDVTMSLASMIPLALLSILIWEIGRRYHKASTLVQEELSKLTSFTSENLAGVRVIQSFVKESFVFRSFERANLSFLRKNLNLARVSGAFRPMMILVAGSATLLVLGLGIQKVQLGAMTLGNLVEFLRYVEILTWPLLALGWVIAIYQRGNAAYKRIQSIIKKQPAIRDQDTLSSVPRIQGNIQFRHVSFSYESSADESNLPNPVLQDLSLHIRRGEKIALVGPTGSGKSTVLSLILRLYESPENSIFIDGIPIERIPLKILRESIGYVSQENFIFPNTVRENILLGLRDSKNGSEQNIKETVIQASEWAHFSQDIQNFPNQYEEWIGEKGVTLSGGQKQRLSIARSLIGEPSILIFDNSFSSVDSKTEMEILRKIFSTFKQKTLIFVSYRVSTIQLMDQVFVIQKGRIEQAGSPNELLRKKDGYLVRLNREEQILQELKK